MNTELAQAQALLNQKQPNPDKAIRTLNRLIQRKQSSWLTYHYLGVAQLQKQEWEKAEKYLKRAIEKGSEESETLHLLSVAFFQQGKFGPAEDFAKQAINKKEDFFKAWLNLGSVYRAEARLDEALKCYQKANQLDPKSSGVAFRIAAIYKDQGDLRKALELFDIAIQIDESYLEAYAEKATILQKLKRFDEAKENLNAILGFEEKHLGAHVGLAEIYKSEGRYEDAIELYKQVMNMYPRVAGVQVNYALCLQEMGRFDESEKNYQEAIDKQPDLIEAYSNYLMGLHYNPKRTKEEIFNEHRKWDARFAEKKAEPRPVPHNKKKDKKLKIGFISGGFRQHPVGWMITKALEHLPKDQVEVYCYTTNNIIDQLTRRISNRALIWRSVMGYDNEVIARVIRGDNVDILVELSGHSEDNRLQMVTLNPAPIVVKWVGGLFNTTGLDCVDYLLTDWHETPAGEEEFYTEKLVRLPDDYICFLAPDYTPDVKALPAKENGYITFGCFNNPTKVNKELFSRWAEIMNQVPNSRLFLKSKQYGTKMFTDRIVEQMELQGISGDRLMFEGESTHDVLLDAYNKVDIALDPWPYSGGLTTCEALWMGVPVVSLPGPTFAGRHAATHLANAGFENLVADNWDTYIQKAVELASDVESLAKMRTGMRDKVANSPLYNGERFGKNLASAFREMWKQRVHGYEESLVEDEWQEHIEIQTAGEEYLMDKKTDQGSVAESTDSIDTQEIENVRESVEAQVQNALGTIEIEERDDTPPQTNTTTEKKTPTHIISTTDGISVSVPQDLNILTNYVLLEQGSWLDTELDFARKYLQPGMKVVDAGAGFGVFALPMAEAVGEEGKVYAFEPWAETSQHLQQSQVENNVKQLKVINKGLSDETSETGFTLNQTPEFNLIDDAGEAQISATTFDAWWQHMNKPNINLFKIDVNGHEYRLLQGAETYLKDESPVIIIAKGEDAQEWQQTAEYLRELEYTFYEYITDFELLVEYEGEGMPDPYRMNLVALKAETAEELRNEGLLFNQKVAVEEPEEQSWRKYLQSLPWTSEKSLGWFNASQNKENEDYLRALDYICAAETSAGLDPNQRVLLMLSAAQALIRIYNQEGCSLPVAFTLARMMNALGKRQQAVQIMQDLMETTNLGQENMHADRPFLLPVKVQDKTSVQTDFQKWLMVRTVEAWLLLKDVSSYAVGRDEAQLLQVLHTNPEVLPEIECRFGLTALRNNLVLNEAEKNIISNSFSASPNQEIVNGLLGIESETEENHTAQHSESSEEVSTPDTKAKIFGDSFWNEPLNPQRAEKIMTFINRFSSLDFDNRLLQQVLIETEERLKEEPTDNVAFFIQVHALLLIPEYQLSVDEGNSREMFKDLESKNWGHKRALYKYWFSSVKYINEINQPKVSAVLISNKFKEKSVENFKRLSEQLDGIGELIFVNNGKADAEFERLMPYIDTYVKMKGNSGAYLARNMGTVFAKGELLLFVDDDGIPDGGMIEAHIKEHEARDILVSRGVYYSDDPADDPWHYSMGDEICPAVTLLEGNAVYSAKAFYQVGGWGDYILFGHGGKELSCRLLGLDPDMNKQIYTPHSRLNHNYVRSLDHQKTKDKKQTYSSYLLRTKHNNFRGIMDIWPDSFSGKNTVSEKKAETGNIWVLDAGLHSQNGHHYTYAKELVKYFEESPQKFTLLTHRAFDESLLPGQKVLPVLTQSPYRFQENVIQGIKESNRITYEELTTHLSEKIQPGDKVVMHTTGINNLQGVLDWYKELPFQPAVEMRICFQEALTNRFAKADETLDRMEEQLLEYASVFQPNLQISCAPESLTKMYAQKLNYIPKAVGCMVKSAMLDVEKDSHKREMEEFLYISSGRDVQGVRLMLELVLKLQGKSTNYRLTVYTGLMHEAYQERFRKLAGDRVHIIEKDDPEYSYDGLIQRSSAVLLPYEPEHFGNKLSGILLDVLAGKTPVLTTKGTYSDTFIKRFDEKPGVTIGDFTTNALYQSIGKFMKHHKKYKQAAQTAAKYVREHYDAQNVIKNTIS
ncbi:MAG: FkbM family methyltransferase [Balneolaceae bacterium]|nr:FkbM family methyltransferase [Balneolaceae bacterium]